MVVSPPVTQLLERLRTGDKSALNELVTVLYDELHRIAARQFRGERASNTLQTTALVHEAYVKLVGGHEHEREFANRAHFLAVASRVMRQVLVDHARAKATLKRSGHEQGSPWQLISTDQVPAGERPGPGRVDLLDLDTALNSLAAEDAALAQLIEMYYFGGMTAEETAEVLGCSVRTVRHDLRLAQSWLRRELSGGS